VLRGGPRCFYRGRGGAGGVAGVTAAVMAIKGIKARLKLGLKGGIKGRSDGAGCNGLTVS
jgi:hypothetical protein